MSRSNLMNKKYNWNERILLKIIIAKKMLKEIQIKKKNVMHV